MGGMEANARRRAERAGNMGGLCAGFPLRPMDDRHLSQTPHSWRPIAAARTGLAAMTKDQRWLWGTWVLISSPIPRVFVVLPFSRSFPWIPLPQAPAALSLLARVATLAPASARASVSSPAHPLHTAFGSLLVRLRTPSAPRPISSRRERPGDDYSSVSADDGDSDSGLGGAESDYDGESGSDDIGGKGSSNRGVGSGGGTRGDEAISSWTRATGLPSVRASLRRARLLSARGRRHPVAGAEAHIAGISGQAPTQLSSAERDQAAACAEALCRAVLGRPAGEVVAEWRTARAREEAAAVKQAAADEEGKEGEGASEGSAVQPQQGSQ